MSLTVEKDGHHCPASCTSIQTPEYSGFSPISAAVTMELLHIIIPLGVDASGSLTFVIVRKCLRQADFTKKGGLSDHNCGTPRAKGLHWISPGPGADVRAAEGRVQGKGHMERQSQ